MRSLSRPELLVLVPSRELAGQIAAVAQRLGSELPRSFALACLASGQRYSPQRNALRTGDVRVLVATPERLLYHVRERNLCLSAVRLLALDEVDMLLCGEDAIAKEVGLVLQELRRSGKRALPPQHVLTAATLSKAQEEVVRLSVSQSVSDALL